MSVKKFIPSFVVCILFCYSLVANELPVAKIIYLNGPSSCGKSTLAKALQESFEDPFLHLGIDKVIDFMPDKINNWEGGYAPLGFSWKADNDATGHPIFHVHAGPFAKRMIETLKMISVLLASQNFNLIIDDVALSGAEVEEWKQLLKNYDVLYVGIVTPLEVLEERERSRGDRRIGSARAQYQTMHKNTSYDLTIDTHAQTTAENVAKIKEALLKKLKK
jgi:chloramphenicol 3-O phosphotransferase